ncbi:DUF2335 domain-containing protein [Methylobacterium platani]|uniref:DUF2335 domain-containing protein n=2 Tax=Methylobacterium platani TaxID=427683 RepID=A0A179SIZ0_9HYPH|nr:DUF2335 domain-containing protein [Methylobacterium platani]KMO18766.1 hypothetical protein SQ03_09615 [Methylobacterium platani JCM 14648]OAS27778.1 hypothetical protein A5481_00150 [Methylobacterium platani]
MSSGPGNVPPSDNRLPQEVRQEILQKISENLDGVVGPELQPEIVDRVLNAIGQGITVTQTEVLSRQHGGPIPAPETVAGYEGILAGSANRLIEMAERDQRAYISSATRAQYLDFSFNIIALIGGVTGLLAILYGVIRLAEQQHDAAAMALAGLGVSGIVGALVNARMKKID